MHATPGVPRRVLVVVEDMNVAMGIAELLLIAGHHVELAGDCTSALRAAREFLPEFVLVDLALPGPDGFDLAKSLQGQPGLESVLIVSLLNPVDLDFLDDLLGRPDPKASTPTIGLPIP